MTGTGGMWFKMEVLYTDMTCWCHQKNCSVHGDSLDKAMTGCWFSFRITKTTGIFGSHAHTILQGHPCTFFLFPRHVP